MSTLKLFALGTCALCLVTAMGCDELLRLLCPCPARDNLELMNQAEQIVHAQYPSFTLIEAWGTPSSGSATVAADIDEWWFIFVAPIDDEPSTVTLGYANCRFDSPEFVSDLWVGTVYERLPRAVSLDQAIEALRATGCTDAFTGVTIRRALIMPEPPEACYAFSIPCQFFLVGAETGEVLSEDFPEAGGFD